MVEAHALVDSGPTGRYLRLMPSATERRGQNGGWGSGRVRHSASGPLVQPIGPEGARPAAPGAVQAMGFQLRGGALFVSRRLRRTILGYFAEFV